MSKILDYILKVILGLMVLFLVQFTAGNIYLDTKFELKNTPNSPYVKIMETVEGKNSRQVCSGAVVSPTYAITAAHCLLPPAIRNFEGITYFIKNEAGNEVLPVEVFKVDYTKDLAVLKGDFKRFIALKVEDAGVDSTKKIEACGFPNGSKKLICHPFKYTGQTLSGGSFKVIGDSQIYPGMSGGPLVDRVRGVVYAVGYGVVIDQGAYWTVTVSPLVNSQGEYGYISSPAAKRPWVLFPALGILITLLPWVFLYELISLIEFLNKFFRGL